MIQSICRVFQTPIIGAVCALLVTGCQIKGGITHVPLGATGSSASVPSALALVTPASSPGTVDQPVIQVSGVAVGETVRLFSDSTCSTAVGSAVVASAPTVNVTVSPALSVGAYTFYANATNAANATSTCSTASVSYTLASISPVVTGVTSTLASGAYKAGQVVPITVTFSSAVTVTGTPQITIALTPANKAINYASGSGTNTLTFNYTVAGADTAADLDYVATTSLALNGGTIQDLSANAATLTLPAPAAAGSLGSNKNLVIDTTAPGVPIALALVTPASSPANNQTPVIQVSGVANTDLVTLYSDSSCTVPISSATASSGATVNVTASSLAAGAYTIYAQSADPAGNVSGCSVANVAYTVDLTAPTVTNVTSSTANGYYKAAQAVSIQVVFSKSVVVTGTPQLTLGTAPNETVNYASGTGTNTLTFTYTVQVGDSSADLDYAATTSLTLNGGTIKDAAGNAATRTLAAPGAATSLGANKNIVIQTAQPAAPTSLSLVTPASSPGNNTTPTVQVGGVVSGYVVQMYSDLTCSTLVGNVTAAGVTANIIAGALADGSYTFYANQTDQAGNISNCSVANVAYVLSTVAPTVTNVTSTLANGSYKLGQVVPITVTFSKVVTVTGTPQITVGLTPANKAINYASGSGTATLTFNYTVAGTDTTSALDYVATNSLALNGGTIQDAATNNATLTLPALAGAGDLAFNKTIVIDTSAPGTPSALTLITPASSPGNNQTPVIRVAGVANTDVVTLYSDSGCTAAISSGTTSSGATVDVTTNSLAAGAYTIYAKSADLAGNTSSCSAANVAYTVDLTAPTVTNVTSSTANGAYKAGQAISIQVVFSKAIIVTGTPQLTLGTTPLETVDYASGTGTTTLTFTYTIQAGDNSADLDYSATSSLRLNGGTLADAAGNAATRTLAAPGTATSLGANKNIVIDTTAPGTPSALALVTPVSSPSLNSTPTIHVAGVANTDLVTLYSDVGCTAAVSSATASAGATVDITTNALGLGAHTIYAKSADPAGNLSGCSAANLPYTVLTTFTVTSSGTNVTITPSAAQTVTQNATQSYTVAANGGRTLSTAVDGTCPHGSWSGGTYTTGAITADCTISFTSLQFAYISSETPANAVEICQVSPTTGVLSGCSVTATFGGADYLDSITLSTIAGNSYAYIADSAGKVKLCSVDPVAGGLSGCADSNGGIATNAWTPFQVTVANVGGNNYAYVTDNSNAHVYHCSVSAVDGTLGGCAINDGGMSFSSPGDIRIVQIAGNTYAYVADYGNSAVYLCAVSTISGALSGCVASNGGGDLAGWVPYSLYINSFGGHYYAHVADLGGNIFLCSVSSVDGTLSGCALSNGGIAPGVWTPNSIATVSINQSAYAYVGDTNANTYLCSISLVDGTLSGCAFSNGGNGAGVFGPYGISIFAP
jgi:hypothetical protein